MDVIDHINYSIGKDMATGIDTLIHRWLRIPYALHSEVTHNARRPRATVLMIHGIGASGKTWDDVIKRLPSDIRIVTIDLLGFSKSPKPTWAIYNAKTQARSVLATFLQLRINSPVIIVGHSLGSLVAVDIAKRYPLVVRSLILCSPPFYELDDNDKRLLPRSDKVLKYIYKEVKKRPEQFVKISSLAVRYKLIPNKAFELTNDTVGPYMDALEAAIINQSSLDTVRKLTLPIHILHGMIDPVVINRHLEMLNKQHPNVKLTHVPAGHEISGRFIDATVKAIVQASYSD